MDSIKRALENIKYYERPLFIVALTVLVASLGFGLGRLSRVVGESVPIRIEMSASGSTEQPGLDEPTDLTARLSPPPEDKTDKTSRSSGQVLASKNGTKYYLPWCGGVRRIKEENKVWFASIDEAKAAGLRPAANCKGL